ncbi:MAG: HAMP domain-containing protein, partial [Armatimonadetes bacterium]|nr:HAMP domain-containing protein [Armatimonadota bacterium]
MWIRLWLPLVIVCASSACFVYALRRRWFSRFKGGFLLTVLIAVMSSGLATAILLGAWGYETARGLLFESTVGDLKHTGDVVEAEIHENIRIAGTHLERLSRVLAQTLSRNDLRRAREEMRSIQSFDGWWLQMDLHDRHGRHLFSTGTAGASEPPNRIAVAFGLEGKPFISEAYMSPVFKTHVLHMSIPIRIPGSSPSGVLSARYALQEDLKSHVAGARFLETGYCVLADNEGSIMAHPDPGRIGENIVSYPAIQSGRQGKSGWILAKNRAGQERLFVYRPVRGPGTINPRDWILLTELEEREATLLIRALGRQSALALGVIMIISLIIGPQVAASVKRPVQDLLHLSARVRQGDFSAQTGVQGRDEMGQLADALNKMIHGLRERD